LPGRTRDGQITQEQAALRQVATLVARAAAPEEVFAAVTAEAGRLLGAHHARMSRYDPDGAARVVATWSSNGAAHPVGTRTPLGGRNLYTLVFQTHQAARLDDYADASGQAADLARKLGVRASIGVPIIVEGRLWGAIFVGSTREPLPADAEARLAGFTELAAIAVANAQARTELRGFAEEQAALRRVATLVARAAPLEEVYAAVTTEAGRVLGADHTTMARYDRDGARTVVAAWRSTGAAFPVRTRASLGGRNVSTQVFQTGRPARIDDYGGASSSPAEGAGEFGFRAVAGVPVSVAGRLWGVMVVGSTREPLPTDAEVRLAGFTELAASAIANAQARVELRSYADEQAALRRVAVLVAQSAPPQKVFAAVTDEAGLLLQVDYTVLSRFDPDGLVTVVGHWTKTDPGRPLAIGLRLKAEGRNIHARVYETGARRGSTTTAVPRAGSPTSPATGSSARRSACRSGSKAGSGAS